MKNYRHRLQYLGQRGPYTQSAMHAFDRNTGIVFYSQVYTNGVGCWNSNTPHSPDNFHLLERNNQTMIYPSDLNVSVPKIYMIHRIFKETKATVVLIH